LLAVTAFKTSYIIFPAFFLLCVATEIVRNLEIFGVSSLFFLLSNLLLFQEPVHLKAGDNLVVHFWRLTDSKKVWYEWTITEPVPVAIHNPKGRSYTIGL